MSAGGLEELGLHFAGREARLRGCKVQRDDALLSCGAYLGRRVCPGSPARGSGGGRAQTSPPDFTTQQEEAEVVEEGVVSVH